MSFRYKGRSVTLTNYTDIFSACPVDIQDEIRSAVLDDTPIAKFIAGCGTNNYLLGQIRMALREMVPAEFLSTKLTAETIRNIREGYRNGVDMSPLLKYYNSGLDVSVIEQLSEVVFMGVDISKIDFNIVPLNLVTTVCKGLCKGYPMWLLIEDGCNLTQDSLNILMRGLSLGVDVHPFLNGKWASQVLLLMFSYAQSVDLNEILKYVNEKFSFDIVQELLRLAEDGVNIAKLCLKDKEGYPVYNNYQIYQLGKGLKAGVDISSVMNPDLDDLSMENMISQLQSAGE